MTLVSFSLREIKTPNLFSFKKQKEGEEMKFYRVILSYEKCEDKNMETPKIDGASRLKRGKGTTIKKPEVVFNCIFTLTI